MKAVDRQIFYEQILAESVALYAGSYEGRKARFAFEQNRYANAHATLEPDFDVIKINTGMYSALLNCSRCLISYPGFFYPPGDIDNVHIDDSPDFQISLFDIEPTEIPYYFTDERAVRLHSPEMEAIARLVASIAEKWIFFHELAHIVDGHLDWIEATRGKSRLSEAPMAGDDLAGIDRQVLEWDADLGATEMLLIAFFRPIKSFVNGVSKWSFDFDVNTDEMAKNLFLLSASIALANIMIASGEQFSVEQLERRTHPPATVRQTYILVLMVDVLEYRAGFARQPTSEVLGSGLSRVWQVWAKIFPRAINPFTDKRFYDMTAEIMRGYHARWHEIRPELDLYKRSGVLRHEVVTT